MICHGMKLITVLDSMFACVFVYACVRVWHDCVFLTLWHDNLRHTGYVNDIIQLQVEWRCSLLLMSLWREICQVIALQRRPLKVEKAMWISVATAAVFFSISFQYSIVLCWIKQHQFYLHCFSQRKKFHVRFLQ